MFNTHPHACAFRSVILGMSAILAVTGSAQAAKFKVFDIPGAGTLNGQGTFPTAISGKNVVTGSYADSAYLSHGFIGPAIGPIVTFDAPGATGGTSPTGINTAGTVTGFYTTDHAHGFVRSSSGTFTSFDVGTDTNPVAINNNGVITGYARPSGFVRASDGSVTGFSTKDSIAMFPTAINGKGVITGHYFDSSNLTHGFVRSTKGDIVTFDAPGGFDHTYGESINSKGDIAGYASTSGGTVFRGFVRTSDGTITVFNPSGCPNTFAWGINFYGVVTGNCFSGDNTYHGFTRWSDGTMETYDAPNAGVGGAGTFPIAIESNGRSVGHLEDNSGVHHGYRLNPIGEPQVPHG
jgi:hypothetical protein